MPHRFSMLTLTLPASCCALLLAAAAWVVTPAHLAAQEADTVQRGVPYMTTRNLTGHADPDRFYGEDRSTLSAGYCDITDRQFELMSSVAEAVPFRVPEEILRVGAVRPTPIDDVLDRLQDTADGASPLLYTHGFFIDFDKGCRRATVMQENANMVDRFVWFSWPSDGNLVNYTQDEADLSWSVLDLSQMIIDLAERFDPAEVNLAGHSLGGRGMAMAIHDVAAQRPDLRLGHVALLAPDMDFDLFARLVPRILPVVRSLTVYVADGDRPLDLSEQVHGYPRLGQSGNDVSILQGVEVIDLSDLQVRSASGHLYHIYNAEVGEDLDQLLNDGVMAASRRNMLQVEPNLWRLQRPE